jgi:hypothetical protein
VLWEWHRKMLFWFSVACRVASPSLPRVHAATLRVRRQCRRAHCAWRACDKQKRKRVAIARRRCAQATTQPAAHGSARGAAARKRTASAMRGSEGAERHGGAQRKRDTPQARAALRCAAALRRSAVLAEHDLVEVLSLPAARSDSERVRCRSAHRALARANRRQRCALLVRAAGLNQRRAGAVRLQDAQAAAAQCERSACATQRKRNAQQGLCVAAPRASAP